MMSNNVNNTVANGIALDLLNQIISDIFINLPGFKGRNQLFSHQGAALVAIANGQEKNEKPKTIVQNVNNNDDESEEKEKEIKFRSNRIIYKDVLSRLDSGEASKEQVIYFRKERQRKQMQLKPSTTFHEFIKLKLNISDDGDACPLDVNREREEGEDDQTEDVYIWQMKVLKQQKNDSCGYYSLFNSMMLLNCYASGAEAEAVQLHADVLCKVKFWYVYNLVLKMLLVHSKEEPNRGYPWNEKYIYKGVLERPYIDYLISTENLLSCQGYPITILPDWSIQSLKVNRLPIDEVKEMARISEIFRREENYIHVFLIGQAVHWIAITVCKRGRDSEIIVMDSRNYNLLGWSDEECIDKVNKHPELPDRMRRAYLCSIREPKIIVKILRDCMIGGKDIVKTLLDLNLTGFLENYYSHVSLELKGHLSSRNFIQSNLVLATSPSSSLIINDEYYPLDTLDEVTIVNLHNQQLLYWLENYYPPSVIEYTICQVLDTVITNQEHVQQYFEIRTLELLSNWIKDTSSHLSKHIQNNNEIPQLFHRFSTTMNWFYKKFI